MIFNVYNQPYVTLEDAEIQKMIKKAKDAGEKPLIRILSNIAIVTLGRRAPIYINAELLPDIMVNVETGEYYTDAAVVGPNSIIFLVPNNKEAEHTLLQSENWSNTAQMQCEAINHVKDDIYVATFMDQVTLINNSAITKNVRTMIFPKNVSSARGFDNNPYLEKLVLNDYLLILEPSFAAESTLKEIKFGKGLLHIAEYSLAMTNLRSVMLPEGLESIGERAFTVCVNLERIYIPNTVKNIGLGAFKATSPGLKQLVLPSSISAIHEQLITGTSIKTLVIPKSVIEISGDGLAGTDLEKLIFEGDAPMYDGKDLLVACSCKNTAIYVPDKYYNNYYNLLYNTDALKHAHLIAYKLEEKVEIQPNNEIWYTTTDNLIIDETEYSIGITYISHTYSNNKGIIKCENDITVISDYTFKNDYTLQTLYLPMSINAIESSAIFHCTNMTDLYYNGTIEQWNTISLDNSWHYSTPISVVHCLDGDVNV